MNKSVFRGKNQIKDENEDIIINLNTKKVIRNQLKSIDICRDSCVFY
jgi:hypothetical protein